jgi:hypothetical protein
VKVYEALTMYRFHFRDSLSLQDWEDQWFQVTCNPHFSLVPYTSEAAIDYARMAFFRLWVASVSIFSLGSVPILMILALGANLRGHVIYVFCDIPPLNQFFGVVDTSKLVLADNPGIGLDDTTRNCSVIAI